TVLFSTRLSAPVATPVTDQLTTCGPGTMIGSVFWLYGKTSGAKFPWLVSGDGSAKKSRASRQNGWGGLPLKPIPATALASWSIGAPDVVVGANGSRMRSWMTEVGLLGLSTARIS